MNARLRRLLLPLLRAAAKGTPPSFRMRSAASQALYLLGKATPKSKGGRLRRIQKRTAHNDETAKLRAACLKRSGGYCECGCGAHFVESMFLERPEMDHFAGRAVPQTEANCWMLTHACHRVRTLNRFPVSHWNQRFAVHAAKHGYPTIAHITHAQLKRSAP